MARLLTIARYAWASPTTVIGLAVVAATRMTGGRARVVNGVLEAHGGAASWILAHAVPLKGGANAMTLGHVVIGRSRFELEATREHERVHVRQCERWGPLFVPAYFAASAIAFCQRRDPYRGNRFEREAYGSEVGAPGEVAGREE